ncbi:MAG: type II toxin-antitoxin system VapC family toxin [Candidatus Hydrothermarchaeales archaeon]
MTVLIDSWAWIEYFRGSETGRKAGRIIEDEEEAVVSTINIAEVYRWVLRFYDEDKAKEKVSAMKQRCFVINVTEEIAIKSAKIKHETKLGLGDAIILATANQGNARVLTGDPDFKGMEDVVYLGD